MRISTVFVPFLSLAFSACCLLDGSIFPGRSATDRQTSPASGNSTANSQPLRQNPPTTTPSSTASSAPNVNPSAPPGNTTATTNRPSANPSLFVRLPQLEITPVPVGIPIPVPFVFPVGLSHPPTSQATPFPRQGSGPSENDWTPAESQLFEISEVRLTRTPELAYRVQLSGQGFGVVESYQFLQARIGPYTIPLIEDGVYQTDNASFSELAIASQRVTFLWHPAQGGPTAEDRFQWIFQPRGLQQLFQTPELEVILGNAAG